MASLVNPFNINGNYPIAGQDNDSQGFRDNFTNIKNNFIFIKQEVEDLQSKVILKSALSGSSLDNNFLGSQVKNIQTKNQSETVYDWGEVGAATATEIQLDLALGNIHKLNATGSIKINSVIKNWPAALQFARLLFYVNISSVENTLELPSTLTTDLSGIPGLRTVSSSRLITFTDPGDYIFEFSSVDSGTTTFVRELTRGNPVFRDPNFYMAGIGGYPTPTLRLGWGNLFAVSAKIDSNTKAGTDTFSVRGGVTSFQNFADGGNNPATMTQAGFSVAKSRTADPGAAGAANPTETVVNTGDYIGYFNGLAFTKNKDDSNNSYQQVAAIGMYATGSNTSYGLGGNIVISTKRDGGVMTPAVTIDNDQNVIITGCLTVNGTTTTINSTVMTVDDKNIIVASGAASATLANGAGLSVDTAFANIEYVNSGLTLASDDRWSFNKAVTIGMPSTLSNSTATGALVVQGGVGVGGDLNVGGTFGLASTTDATSSTTGAFSVAGGISAQKNIIAGTNLYSNATTTASNLNAGAFQVQGGAAIKGNLYVGGQTVDGALKGGMFVLAGSRATDVSTGALVVKGGVGIAGNLYVGDAGGANGLVITSTLRTNGTAMINSNADARSATAALRVIGGTLFESNVVIGIGSGSQGRVFIDNSENVTAGDISTGGLVLGNGSARVGMSVSGDINIGTSDSGSIFILNREAARGTPITSPIKPNETVLTGGNPTLGAMTALGGVNVFGNLHIGQPHDGTSYDNNTNTWSGVYNGATTKPVGAWSGNLVLNSGAWATNFNSGALQIKQVILADGSTSDGGLGVAGNVYANGASYLGGLGFSSSYANLVAASSTESTKGGTDPNGSLTVLGGAGIQSKLNVGGVIAANAGINSTSKTIGSIVITGSGGLGVGGGITAANISLDAATNTQESLLVPTGTLLTTPKVGAVEFASGVWYATPTTSSRAVIQTPHMYVISGNAAFNNGSLIPTAGTNTAYGIFGGTSGTAGQLTVAASTTYEFEIQLNITHALTPSSGTLLFNFGGTATYTMYHYQVSVVPQVYTDGVATAAAPTSPVDTVWSGTTTLPSISTGQAIILTANTLANKSIRAKGILVINVGGTVIPQIGFGAPNAPGVITRALQGSYWKMSPVGGASDISTGNFAAS
jgi:hypothetical protein